jgi:hypothetical protein
VLSRKNVESSRIGELDLFSDCVRLVRIRGSQLRSPVLNSGHPNGCSGDRRLETCACDGCTKHQAGSLHDTGQ